MTSTGPHTIPHTGYPILPEESILMLIGALFTSRVCTLADAIMGELGGLFIQKNGNQLLENASPAC